MEYLFNCRECKKPDKEYSIYDSDTPKVVTHRWARFDYYGIYTELCCDKCYANGNYSYKKGRY